MGCYPTCLKCFASRITAYTNHVKLNLKRLCSILTFFVRHEASAHKDPSIVLCDSRFSKVYVSHCLLGKFMTWQSFFPYFYFLKCYSLLCYPRFSISMCARAEWFCPAAHINRPPRLDALQVKGASNIHNANKSTTDCQKPFMANCRWELWTVPFHTGCLFSCNDLHSTNPFVFFVCIE